MDIKKKIQEIIGNKKLLAVILIVIIILIASFVAFSGILNGYKEVDSKFFSHPVPGEKVQFKAEYVGTTTWNISSVPENDVIKVEDKYFILTGDNDLSGNEGHTVLIKGSVLGYDRSTEPISTGKIEGRWFVPDEIEILD